MKKNRLLFLAFISSALVIFMEFTQWKIIDIVTEFLMVPIWIFVFVLFAIITVRAIIHLVKNRDWKPFAIQFMTLLLWIFFPFTQVVLDVDFKVNKAEREEVVRMVENGELKPNLLNDQSFIRLPKKNKHLSKGGEIMIEKNNDDYTIFFFTFRGISDNFSGFVYSPNDQRPSKHDFSGDFKEIKRLDKNWFWVGSY
ncbi:hypothetical protein [Anoxybacteroides rupiense]|uniref:hypothetical protein n=1 Tax=Anoxybacteroides rupiense TaxID=311460 RepID=UPI003FA5C694